MTSLVSAIAGSIVVAAAPLAGAPPPLLARPSARWSGARARARGSQNGPAGEDERRSAGVMRRFYAKVRGVFSASSRTGLSERARLCWHLRLAGSSGPVQDCKSTRVQARPSHINLSNLRGCIVFLGSCDSSSPEPPFGRTALLHTRERGLSSRISCVGQRPARPSRAFLKRFRSAPLQVRGVVGDAVGLTLSARQSLAM